MGFLALEGAYRRLLGWTLANRAITIAVALGTFALALGFASRLDSEFFPPTDTGIFFAQLETAPGTSIESTLEYLERDEGHFLAQPEMVGMFSSAGAAASAAAASSQLPIQLSQRNGDLGRCGVIMILVRTIGGTRFGRIPVYLKRPYDVVAGRHAI